MHHVYMEINELIEFMYMLINDHQKLLQVPQEQL
jgi:hypothetical protein